MSGQIQLDEMDEAIIASLLQDGRLSNRAIARQIGMSESAVRKRLKYLVEVNAISYGLIVDMGASDMTVSGWMQITCTPSTITDVVSHIESSVRYGHFGISTGEHNLWAYVYAETRADMASQLENISNIAGVLDTRFREILYNAHHRVEYIILPIEEHVGRWPV